MRRKLCNEFIIVLCIIGEHQNLLHDFRVRSMSAAGANITCLLNDCRTWYIVRVCAGLFEAGRTDGVWDSDPHHCWCLGPAFGCENDLKPPHTAPSTLSSCGAKAGVELPVLHSHLHNDLLTMYSHTLSDGPHSCAFLFCL